MAMMLGQRCMSLTASTEGCSLLEHLIQRIGLSSTFKLVLKKKPELAFAFVTPCMILALTFGGCFRLLPCQRQLATVLLAFMIKYTTLSPRICSANSGK